jgi:hypothetical protein
MRDVISFTPQTPLICAGHIAFVETTGMVEADDDPIKLFGKWCGSSFPFCVCARTLYVCVLQYKSAVRVSWFVYVCGQVLARGAV